MDTRDFQRFIEFVELDQRIDRLTKEQRDLVKKRELLEAKIAGVKQETATAHTTLHDLRKAIDLLELELKSVAEKKNEKKRKIAAANSPKEFFSLEHEIADLEKKQIPLDEQGLVLLTNLEQAQAIYDRVKAEEPEKVAHAQQELEELVKTVEHNERLLEVLNDQIVKDEGGVPTDIMDKYWQMKERVSNPAVPILRGSCSACFYAISQHDLGEAQHNQLITCRDCYRLLYFQQIEKEQ